MAHTTMPGSGSDSAGSAGSFHVPPIVSVSDPLTAAPYAHSLPAHDATSHDAAVDFQRSIGESITDSWIAHREVPRPWIDEFFPGLNRAVVGDD